MPSEEELKKIGAGAPEPVKIPEVPGLHQRDRDFPQNPPKMEDRIYRELADIRSLLESLQKEVAEIKRIQLGSRTP